MIGLIRVVSGLDDEQVNTHARAIRHLVDDEIVSRAIADQPTGIHDDETFALAVPKIVEVGRALAAEGARLIIVSCAADPAVPELRTELAIPVVGAGSAGAALALAAGSAVGVLGITPVVPAAVTDILGDRLVADLVPDGVTSTNDLERPSVRAAALDGCDRMKQQGAQSILFACTGLTTIGLAGDVHRRTGLPVIDAVFAAGTVASFLLSRDPTDRSTHDN